MDYFFSEKCAYVLLDYFVYQENYNWVKNIIYTLVFERC